jgi:hypothetical protein
VYMSELGESRARHSPRTWAFSPMASEGYKRVSESIYEIPPLTVKPSRGLAQKLQATTRGSGLFRIKLLSLVSNLDFCAKPLRGVIRPFLEPHRADSL